MKKFISNKNVLYILGILFNIGLWWLLSVVFDTNSMIFPSPYSTFLTLIELLGKSNTYRALGFSLIKLFLGFAISSILAFLLALLVNDNEKLYQFLSPTMTFLKSVPTATMIFLFIVLSGASNAPLYVVVVICFPILYESFVQSFTNTNPYLIEAARIDGASKIKRLLKVQLPTGLPFIILGIVSSFGLAFKIEIMAEIITGYTRGGLGSMIKNSQVINPTDLTVMFAYSLLAVVMMILITFVASKTKAILTKKFGLN